MAKDAKQYWSKKGTTGGKGCIFCPDTPQIAHLTAEGVKTAEEMKIWKAGAPEDEQEPQTVSEHLSSEQVTQTPEVTDETKEPEVFEEPTSEEPEQENELDEIFKDEIDEVSPRPLKEATTWEAVLYSDEIRAHKNDDEKARALRGLIKMMDGKVHHRMTNLEKLAKQYITMYYEGVNIKFNDGEQR